MREYFDDVRGWLSKQSDEYGDGFYLMFFLAVGDAIGLWVSFVMSYTVLFKQCVLLAFILFGVMLFASYIKSQGRH